jgi:hypothetical protein
MISFAYPTNPKEEPFSRPSAVIVPAENEALPLGPVSVRAPFTLTNVFVDELTVPVPRYVVPAAIIPVAEHCSQAIPEFTMPILPLPTPLVPTHMPRVPLFPEIMADVLADGLDATNTKRRVSFVGFAG